RLIVVYSLSLHDALPIWMFVAGFACMIVGWCWNPWFPINKSLWTSSYVFFTAGLALEFLALCYWLIDIKGYKKWTKPFVILVHRSEEHTSELQSRFDLVC